jgi:hypothetical protein
VAAHTHLLYELYYTLFWYCGTVSKQQTHAAVRRQLCMAYSPRMTGNLHQKTCSETDAEQMQNSAPHIKGYIEKLMQAEWLVCVPHTTHTHWTNRNLLC